ncbi:MAG: flagellar basal body rod C-terminal domain-containing protein, partial [Panacagrimonas sp.]
FASANTALVSSVGNQAQQAGVARGAQESLLAQSLAARDATSGVSLDEEAADLVRFQQAYQAAAQVIAAADAMFQTLLAATQR